jgi:hypothetical protein
MKKICLFFLLALALVLPLTGCNQDIFKTADALYLDIKVLVLDEDIRPLIPDKTMERLARVEKAYLSASKLKAVAPDNIRPLELLIACADEILLLLDDLDLGERHERHIAAVRISVKVLRNHIQLE